MNSPSKSPELKTLSELMQDLAEKKDAFKVALNDHDFTTDQFFNFGYDEWYLHAIDSRHKEFELDDLKEIMHQIGFDSQDALLALALRRALEKVKDLDECIICNDNQELVIDTVCHSGGSTSSQYTTVAEIKRDILRATIEGYNAILEGDISGRVEEIRTYDALPESAFYPDDPEDTPVNPRVASFFVSSYFVGKNNIHYHDFYYASVFDDAAKTKKAQQELMLHVLPRQSYFCEHTGDFNVDPTLAMLRNHRTMLRTLLAYQDQPEVVATVDIDLSAVQCNNIEGALENIEQAIADYHRTM